MIVAHATHVTPLPAPLWVAVAILSGLAAAIFMNVPMLGLPEGYTPAVVTTSVIQQTVPSQVSSRAAVAVHHAFGPLAGAAYAVCGIALDGVFPPVSRVAGLSLGAHAVAVALVTAFSFGVFAYNILPQYGGAARDRAGAVRRHWLASTAVFGASLGIVVPLAATAVR
ncbi:hypothetical protein ACFR9U_01825 [Halorientalis brevis]|uniref:Uncharacterized protein n=1 Tax=Halorientalis brevis TaxID=1126241 RepID=A0ABD6C7N8_9EURY|nr:hypothetical protein [Halorientalis brevis]